MREPAAPMDGMSAPDDFDALPLARQAARGGDWARVRELLAAWRGLVDDAEAGLLYAESLLRLRQSGEARRWLEQVVPVYERRADRAALRRAVNMIGIACLQLGDLDDAHAAHLRAVNLALADGDDLLLARATNNLGIVANVRGRRAEALANYQLAVPAYQRLGHVLGMSECFHNMAISYRDSRDLGRADECARRAIEYAREAGSDRLLALARLGRAEIIYRQGDAELAGANARLVVNEFATQSDPVGEADARRISGLALLREGRLTDAHDEVRRALSLAQGCGAVLAEAEATRALAEVLLARRDRAGAVREGRQAQALFERLGATSEAEDVARWMDDAAGERSR